MVDGRRVTDEAMLEVVAMVYAGLNATSVVANLQMRGCNAISLSGPDGNLLTGRKRPVGDVDFGFAGDVRPDDVNLSLLQMLIENGYVPVLNSLTHDGGGVLLNTNADTIASTVAAAMAKTLHVTLIMILDRPGVLANPLDSHSVMPVLSSVEIERMKNDGVIAGGMLPKMVNAVAALNQGVETVRVGDYTALKNVHSGTRIVL